MGENYNDKYGYKIWMRFVEEAKVSNITDLCKMYGITRQSGHYWIRQYRNGPLCVLCGLKPFEYLQSRYCKLCRFQQEPPPQTAMDKQYAKGKLFNDEQMEIEAFTIIEHLRTGMKAKDIEERYGKGTTWVTTRLKSIGGRVRDYKSRITTSSPARSVVRCSKTDDIKRLEREIKRLKIEVGKLKKRKLRRLKPIGEKKPTQQLFNGKRNIVPRRKLGEGRKRLKSFID